MIKESKTEQKIQDADQAGSRVASSATDRARRKRRQSRSAAALMLQAKALRYQRFHPAALSVATALARQLKCERVSIGFRWRGQTRIDALSNTADVASQQNVVRYIGEAIDESIDQQELVVFPMPRGSSPIVTVAHERLAQSEGVGSVLTVPIVVDGQAVGAFILQRECAFSAESIESAKDAATFCGPVLELIRRQDLPVTHRVLEVFRPRNALQRSGDSVFRRRAIASAVGLLAIALAWPVTYRVVAPARVEGVGQRILAAPVDGFVKSVALRPGASVRKGQVIAMLDDHDLSVQRDQRRSETAKLDKEYRGALTKNDAAKIVNARSKLRQSEVELKLVERQLQRTLLVAPIDGLLISGDLSQSIGMPVSRGQDLVTVAPDDSFRIVADVDEQDIDLLRRGLTGRVMFAATERDPLDISITRIAPVAVIRDERNVFEVDANVSAENAELRHGLHGVARLDISTRSLGWVWWHRASKKVRRLWWRLVA